MLDSICLQHNFSDQHIDQHISLKAIIGKLSPLMVQYRENEPSIEPSIDNFHGKFMKMNHQYGGISRSTNLIVCVSAPLGHNFIAAARSLCSSGALRNFVASDAEGNGPGTTSWNAQWQAARATLLGAKGVPQGWGLYIDGELMINEGYYPLFCLRLTPVQRWLANLNNKGQ